MGRQVLLVLLLAAAMAFASIARGEQVISFPLDDMDALLTRDGAV